MRILLLLCLLFWSQLGLAEKLNVLACEPEWAALAMELGGDSVKVHSATTYRQDPHHIQARPSLIAKTRKADLLVCSGAELEVGWLPVLLRKGANARIQPGSKGYFMATDHVSLLGKRDSADRSEGDVHMAGNPHIHFDPYRMMTVADALQKVLAQLMPAQKDYFLERLESFKTELQNKLTALEKDKQALAGKRLVVHHDNWPYLFEWLEMEKVAELEPKPGLPPSSSHLAGLLQDLQQSPAELIIYSSYQDSKASNWLSKRANMPAVALPYSVDKWKEPRALMDFYSELVTTIVQAGSQ